MTDILGKIKGNFFAIIVPGIFIMMIVTVSLFSFLSILFPCLTDAATLGHIWKAINDSWIFMAMFLMLSFLFGNLTLAKSVHDTDKATTEKRIKALKNKPIRAWELLALNDVFPYPDIIKATRDNIKRGLRDVDQSFLPSDWRLTKREQDTDMLHNCYDYWKAVLIKEQPSLASHCREYEGRVRLFSGMYQSGSIGLFLSFATIFFGALHLILLGLAANRITLDFFYDAKVANAFIVIGIIGAVISFLLKENFGNRIRRVRVQEVAVTYVAYTAYKQIQTQKYITSLPRWRYAPRKRTKMRPSSSSSTSV